MKVSTKDLQSHVDCIQLFGLEPSRIDDRIWHNEWGWAIRPHNLAVRDLGDRLLISATFAANETGDESMHNMTVFMKGDVEMRVNKTRGGQVQFQIAVDAVS